MFIDLVKKEHDYVTYGDNSRGKIKGEGIVIFFPQSP